MAELSAGCGTSISAKASGSISGNGFNNARGRYNLTNTEVARIHNENVSRTVYEQAGRNIKFRAGCGPAISTKPGSSVSSNGLNNARGRHNLPDSIVQRI